LAKIGSGRKDDAAGSDKGAAEVPVKTVARAAKKTGASKASSLKKNPPKAPGQEAKTGTRKDEPAAVKAVKSRKQISEGSATVAGGGAPAELTDSKAAPKDKAIRRAADQPKTQVGAGTRSASSGKKAKANKAKAASVSAAPAATVAATEKASSPKKSRPTRTASNKPAAGSNGALKNAPAAQEKAAMEKGAPKSKSGRKSGAKTASANSKAAKTDSHPADIAASKPWLKSYPEGIPAEIEPFRHNSIADMLLEACRRFGSRPAFTSMGKSISFAELEKASRDFAAYLQSTGLKKGARIAVMMPNLLQYPVVIMAVLRAGYVVVNVNPLYTARELEHQLNDSSAEAIVILENFAKALQAAIGGTNVKHVIVASMGDMLGIKGHVVNLVVRRVKKLVPAWSIPGHATFRQAMRQGAAARFSQSEVSLDDIAFLQYTGGTTGVAKGAVLLHRNVLANVMQSEIWLRTAYLSERKEPERLVFVCALPLYHIYAMTVNAMTGIKLGAENIMIPNPRDIPALVKEVGKYPFNVFIGLNTLFNALLNNKDFRKLNFEHLHFTLGGGMAVQRSVAERWKTLTGHTISEGYGLSETSPVATINRLDRDEFTGTIGLPLPSTEVAIRDDNGRDVKLGEVGEICIRGPQVMPGYWNQPEETAKVIMPDGFLKTGDMGSMDETGHIRIVDRKKDMILVSGFNVYPNEIEDVLAHHPGVLEVAAIGVPDEHSGEVPKVFVVKKDPSLTEKDILAYCRENLTGYKRPRHVEFRSELPKTNVGKILRRELR